jgi:hypothetical protein
MPQVYDKNSAREGPNVSAATSLGPQMTKWLSLSSAAQQGILISERLQRVNIQESV